jgi:serine/threonine protein kinase
LDYGRSGPKTSVDSALTGPVRNYLPGDVVDGAYQLTAVLGRGGMGVVFACRHLVLGQNYAIKILSGETLSSEYWSRFQAEAKVLAKLNHPGIVGIYNMGIDSGTCPYYVMDLLSGEGLDSLIGRCGPLPVNQALDCFIQVADGLSCAHAQGIIHRDIKPSNLMLIEHDNGQTGRVKIVDFGIARLSKQGLGAQSQTATGLIFGTPFYMSPEQCQGLRVDERSDIYSFGCALFEALTGSPPLTGENAFQTFMMHQTETPPRLADRLPGAHFAHSLELAMDKMLRKNPADRYQKIDQVKHDLERIRAGKEIMTRAKAGTITTNLKPDTISHSEEGRETEASSNADHRWPLWSKLVLFLAVPMLLLGCSLFVWNLIKPSTKFQPHAESVADEELINLITPVSSLRKAGCTEEEINFFRHYKPDAAHDDREEVHHTFEKILEQAIKHKTHFLNKHGTVFNFPPHIIIGALGIGQGTPVFATGAIKVLKGEDLCFYQSYSIKSDNSFVEMFGPTDLTGLELTLDKPKIAIEKIAGWTRLKHLSFFNSLRKPMPGWEWHDQSKLTEDDLPAVDKFTNLETLGLCGPDVSGARVAQMSLIRKIKSLRLKQIRNIDTLLKILPQLDNLKEVWLLSNDTTNEQLAYLAKMKNLESLRIRRSLLTPKSLEVFRQMHSLKHLYLDRNWTAEEKHQFKEALPFCQFESVIDSYYWQSLKSDG